MKILLTAVGGPSGICFAKSLSKIDGVRLIGTSAEEDTIGRALVDAFYLVPLANDPEYLDTLREIIAKEKIDVIVPTVDEEMCVLSEHADSLGCKVLVSPFTTIAFTSNKSKMYEVAADYLPKRYQKNAIDAFPIFVKPHVGRGGKGTFVATSEQDLIDAAGDKYIFQELLQNPEVSVDTLFDLEGRLVIAVPRIRALIDQGISISGRVFRDDMLTNVIRGMAERLRFVGPVNFQFMRGRDGYKLTEINARGPGGMGITIHSGVDIPKLAYELMATGKISRIPEVREGVYPNFEEVLERQRRKKLAETKSV